LLKKCWDYFDRVVAGAPAELRKGPRGGGRDRDKIVDHVQEAERGGYAPRFGIRVPPRTPWSEQRQAIVAALLGSPADTKWPLRYAVRRTAWHVLDHAWEIEDRSTIS
jgi:lambda repressor-like predicted transcriptional regulator